MTAHLAAPRVFLTSEPSTGPSLVDSARYEQPHTRALRRGLERYGPTPTYDALTAEFSDQTATHAGSKARKRRPTARTRALGEDAPRG